MERCAECGSLAGASGCGELFERLLALDYSQRPPWGPLHAVVVACFYLQHPQRSPGPHAGSVRWTIVQQHLAGGLPAVAAFTSRARQMNSHRRSGSREPPVLHEVDLPGAPPPRAYDTTIADVAVDGTFPARGHEERVAAWAAATVTAWSSR